MSDDPVPLRCVWLVLVYIPLLRYRVIWYSKPYMSFEQILGHLSFRVGAMITSLPTEL